GGDDALGRVLRARLDIARAGVDLRRALLHRRRARLGISRALLRLAGALVARAHRRDGLGLRLRAPLLVALDPRQLLQRFVELALQRAGAADREVAGLGLRRQRLELRLRLARSVLRRLRARERVALRLGFREQPLCLGELRVDRRLRVDERAQL